MEFKAVPRTIADTLDLKRKYIIPRFQREYSWGNDELNELWDDLVDNYLVNNDKLTANEYFIGSLVLVGDDDDNINIERQVVDGQQRLMTITIAFSVLFQLFTKLGHQKLGEKVYSYIMGEDADGVEYPKLITESPKPYFQYKVQLKDNSRNDIPTTDEEKRILNAYNFFERKLAEKSYILELEKRYPSIEGKIDYLEVLKVFRDQILNCKVIYVTVKSFEDAYTIFEVLNAKGKNLSSVDIIKNALFSIIDTTEPVDLAEEQWKKIKKNTEVGTELQLFYRHFWLSKYNFTTAKRLVKDFNSHIEKNQDSYVKFLDELVIASEDYKKIVSPCKEDWKQPEDLCIFYSLEAFDIFGVTQVRSFLLALFDVRRKNLISHKEFVSTISFLEQFHLVFNAVCSMRPSGLERRYSSYARKLRACLNKNQSKECVRDLINVMKQTMPSEEQFVKDLKGIEYTSYKAKNKRLVQYLLKKIEFRLTETNELQPLSFTIEHIMPESTQNEFCGKLGNLLPLGERLNNELNNKPFGEKMKRYPESKYQSVIHFVEENTDKIEWTEEMIEHRTEELGRTIYEI